MRKKRFNLNNGGIKKIILFLTLQKIFIIQKHTNTCKALFKGLLYKLHMCLHIIIPFLFPRLVFVCVAYVSF